MEERTEAKRSPAPRTLSRRAQAKLLRIGHYTSRRPRKRDAGGSTDELRPTQRRWRMRGKETSRNGNDAEYE